MSVDSNVLIRLTGPVYADSFSEMMTYSDPVTVASQVFDQSGDMPNPDNLSDLFVTWGQFVDHDLSHTPDASGEFVFSPGLVAPMERSIYDAATGTDGPREQVNTLTPAMDASMVYGSDEARTELLRSFEGGRLKVDEADLMPLAPAGTMAGSTAENPLFLAGDVRANENTGLTTMHTLFVREHNYWADRLAEARPNWTDHRIFETARKVVEYEIQKITMTDWLPHLIGEAAPGKQAFDASVDLQISNEFSTAAFRFGHTMVSSQIARLEENGAVSQGGPLTVRDVFFNIDPITDGGLSDLLRGAAASTAQEADAMMIDDLNFFLENPAGLSGFSLAALNILRARDHGLDTYVNTRAALLGDIDPDTLDPTDFSVITSDANAAQRLADSYATVHDVDLWVGGLAEDAQPGAQLGATFSHIIAEQFTRTAAGDDGFMELPRGIPRKLRKEIKASDLSDIMLRNTDIQSLQDDVFIQADRATSGSKPDLSLVVLDPLEDPFITNTPFDDLG